MILADALRANGLDPSAVVAHRVALHPLDADADYQATADLARTGHALIYQRLQDGPLFGIEALVAAFIAGNGGTACFAGLRKLVARRPGLAPGDIVYDPELAHLLHNFIGRAGNPTFYDAFEDIRGTGLAGLTLHWPTDGDCRRADDPALVIVETTRS